VTRPILIRGAGDRPSRRTDGIADVYWWTARWPRSAATSSVRMMRGHRRGGKVWRRADRPARPPPRAGVRDSRRSHRCHGGRGRRVHRGVRHANTDPPLDNQGAIGFVVSQAQRAGKARCIPIGRFPSARRGEPLGIRRADERRGGCGQRRRQAGDEQPPMRTPWSTPGPSAFRWADHCEEITLAHAGAMHEGIVATRLAQGDSAAAEEIHVARDIILSELTGGHVHLCHMSTRGSVDLIRRPRKRASTSPRRWRRNHFTA